MTRRAAEGRPEAPPAPRRSGAARALRVFSGHGHFARFLRFLIAGAVNTAVGYAIFAALVLLGLGAQAALALAFVLGVLWNYVSHARFVFGQGGARRLPAYGAAYLLLWALNALALRGLEAAGWSPLAAQGLITPFAAVLSFFLIARVLTGAFPAPGRR